MKGASSELSISPRLTQSSSARLTPLIGVVPVIRTVGDLGSRRVLDTVVRAVRDLRRFLDVVLPVVGAVGYLGTRLLFDLKFEPSACSHGMPLVATRSRPSNA